MRLESYEIKAKDSLMTFEFISEGPKGAIKKRVQFQKTSRINLYNLAFGDVNDETDDFDDTVISDNNDAVKVLNTVANTVKIFLNNYPMAKVYAKGSNVARTRLYRIGISNNLEYINEQFKVLGQLDDRVWFEYEKNQNYSAFLIEKK